ncbi:MAG: archease [Methanospirillum sp.]|nr:archease [Methanospirillum sp.]
MSFEERDHTADILMHITAPDLEGLMTDAASALMTIMYRGSARPVRDVKITVQGLSPEHLLHAFLSEVLYVSEVENLVFSDIRISIRDGELHATLAGEPFNQKLHGGGAEVKGISWYGLSICKDKNEYSCDVLFDV